MAIIVCTDSKWKPFKYGYQVPRKIMKNQFGHLYEDNNDDNFFKYRKYWYHITDFMRLNSGMEGFADWQAYTNDTYFSGVVLKVSDDLETYMVGTYFVGD